MKKIITGFLLLMLILSVIACASPQQSSKTSSGVPAPMPAPAPAPPMFSEGDYRGNAGSLPSAGEERMVVRNGNISLVVADVVAGREKITLLATGLGGYVVSSSIHGEETEMRANITIRVPDDKFEAALAEMRELAVRVDSENTNSQDVTEEYVDLKARLNNAEATEQQYLTLLDKAGDVEDILRIYDSLSRVRGEIEQLKGRIQYLERTASMALISVSLEPEGTAKGLVRAGWNAWEVLKSAVRGIVVFGQVLGTVAIWLLIFSPVWGGILWFVYWRHRRRKAKK
ncbi:DUF4349 domain-containing protein [Chloroflexota bacterium]